MPAKECTHTTYIYIYAHEFPLAINAVTTADLVVACAYVVGRACMMSKMRMPQTLSKFRYVESPSRQARCSRHPCEKIMKVHMHANQIVRARTCRAKTRLPPRLSSAWLHAHATSLHTGATRSSICIRMSSQPCFRTQSSWSWSLPIS